MKNYIQSGDTITLAAPYAVSSGGGAKVGDIVGIAQTDAALAASVALVTRGVFPVVKPGSQAWTAGVAIYWDDTNKNFTSTASTHKKVGYAVEAVGAGAGETTGKVWLPGL